MSEARRVVGELNVDANNLYREESYTDLKVASLKRLVPVTTSGEPDPAREQRWIAQTQLMSQVGPVPVSCLIEAKTLQEAIAKFPEAVSRAVEEMIEEAREIQRSEASRIVVPDTASVRKIIT
jgi:hypothetical protein